ncbi:MULTISPECIES: glycosyltransferase [unclassified Thioalkalivibrio]|uniref:glycosyltransferase n=1 Tax=unclassified Thioalkalivibrio TaxID=2621013 RepID=UPI000366797F|nr:MULTISPECIES: glycosyltransferase [unclassified Thioalkalivibrio]
MTTRDPEKPLVSVIMPAYNTAAYIAESVDSVLDQDYPSVELIVVDDGSTDGTIEVLRAYGDRLTLLTQQNQGAAVARNAGIAAASGDYIAFIDSDDVWLPGKLAAQVGYMDQHPQIGMTFTAWHNWKPDPSGTFLKPDSAEGVHPKNPDGKSLVERGSGWLYNRLLFGSLPHTITVMMRRDLVERVGQFDPELKRGQDYDYWLRASRLTEIHQLNLVTALYRLHGEGCITKYPDTNYEYEVVRKALRRWGRLGPRGEKTSLGAIRRRLAQTCFSFGYHHYWEGDPRLALRSFRQSALRYPWSASAWAYLALSAWKSVGRKAH